MRREAFNLIESMLIEKKLSAPILELGAVSTEYQTQTFNLRELCNKYNRDYLALDINPNNGIDIVADATAVNLVRYNKPRTVICTDFLEHCKDPAAVMRQCFKNMKTYGTIITTVHDIDYRRHCEDDYFRFTLNGLKAIMDCFRFRQIGQFGKDGSGEVDHYIVATKEGEYPYGKN